jgi:EpsI family protein
VGIAQNRISSARPAIGISKTRMTKDITPILLSLVLLFCGGYPIFFHAVPILPGEVIRSLPDSMGEWAADRDAVAPAAFASQMFDYETAKSYRNIAGGEMAIYIAYLNEQTSNKQLISQTTKALLKGASTIRVEGPARASVQINRVLKEEGGKKTLLLLWYHVNGHILAHPTLVKAHTAWSALAHGRTNGSLIVVISDATDGQEPSEIQQQSQAMFQAAWPLIETSLPGT